MSHGRKVGIDFLTEISGSQRQNTYFLFMRLFSYFRYLDICIGICFQRQLISNILAYFKPWNCQIIIATINDTIAKRVFNVWMKWNLFETFQMLQLHALIGGSKFNIATKQPSNMCIRVFRLVTFIEPGTHPIMLPWPPPLHTLKGIC